MLHVCCFSDKGCDATRIIRRIGTPRRLCHRRRFSIVHAKSRASSQKCCSRMVSSKRSHRCLNIVECLVCWYHPADAISSEIISQHTAVAIFTPGMHTHYSSSGLAVVSCCVSGVARAPLWSCARFLFSVACKQVYVLPERSVSSRRLGLGEGNTDSTHFIEVNCRRFV